MSNLETLNLSLSISVKETFIDGYNLKNKIINRMSRLNKFTFDIHSIMRINNEIILPSKEDIQNTFKHFQSTQIISVSPRFVPFFVPHGFVPFFLSEFGPDEN